MAAKKAINRFSGPIDKLRREPVETVANASRILSRGVQKLADKELKALREYYQEMMVQMKAARRSDSIKDRASRQLDLMQDTVNRMISSARQSFTTVAEVRDELTQLITRKADKINLPEIEQIKAPARKALGRMKKAASRAEATAAKVVASLGDHVEAVANPAVEAASKALAGKRGRRTTGATAARTPAKMQGKSAGAASKPAAAKPASKPGRRKATPVSAEILAAPKARRGRPKSAAAAPAAATPAKRGRKPKAQTVAAPDAAAAPAKRGRKPKAASVPMAAASAEKKPRKARVMKSKSPMTVAPDDQAGDSAST